jgi:hypothetical protein
VAATPSNKASDDPQILLLDEVDRNMHGALAPPPTLPARPGLRIRRGEEVGRPDQGKTTEEATPGSAWGRPVVGSLVVRVSVLTLPFLGLLSRISDLLEPTPAHKDAVLSACRLLHSVARNLLADEANAIETDELVAPLFPIRPIFYCFSKIELPMS